MSKHLQAMSCKIKCMWRGFYLSADPNSPIPLFSCMVERKQGQYAALFPLQIQILTSDEELAE